MSAHDLCERCGHERFCHQDASGRPRSCAAKDEGAQCVGFVESLKPFTLEDIMEAADKASAIRGAARASYVESPEKEWFDAFFGELCRKVGP